MCLFFLLTDSFNTLVRDEDTATEMPMRTDALLLQGDRFMLFKISNHQATGTHLFAIHLKLMTDST